ncbi:Colicin V secretion protein CvaA [compost metagenome]
MGLFRPEAVEARRRRLWGEVRLAQPPSFAIWTLVLVLVCSAVLLALVFGRYTRKETVQGFIMPEAGVVQVRAVQAGRIARVLVADGQAVAAGDPLVEFVSDLASSGTGPVLDLQLAETDAQQASLEVRKAAVIQGIEAEGRRLSSQVGGGRRTREILAARRRVQAEALALVEADADRLVALQVQGYATNAQVDARRRAVLSERAALADIDERLSALDAATENFEAQIAALPARLAEAAASIASDRSALVQRSVELKVQRGHLLRAPVAGVVSAVQARTGMSPSTDQPLMAIAPSGSALEARLLVPTRAAGFLTIGQEARLQVEAFPFQRFGFVSGRLEHIATTVIRPGEANFPIAHDEPVYEVRVRLDRAHVIAYGKSRPLQAGMALRADLPIDRRRLWQQLFDPLLAAGKRAA